MEKIHLKMWFILLTLIVTHGTNAQTCSGTISTIGTFGNSTTLTGVSTLTTNYSSSPTATIAINGSIIINTNLTITNANIILGPGAELIVGNNYTLTITGSWLHACSSTMWNRIHVPSSSATLKIEHGSLIEDAETAVHSEYGGKYTIEDSRLNRNFRHIKLNDYSGNYSGVIKGSHLSCVNVSTGSNVSNLLSPHNGERTFIGIEASKVANFHVGDASASTNYFTNLDCGIFIMDGSAEIYNNTFRAPLAASPITIYMGEPMVGIGIYKANNREQDGLPNDLTIGGTGNAENDFYEIPRGIVVRGWGDPGSSTFRAGWTNCYIYNNNFDRAIYPMEIVPNSLLAGHPEYPCTIDIQGNELKEFDGGIKCTNASGCPSFVISNNSLTASSSISYSTGMILYGIWVMGVPSASGRYIKNMEINNNWIYQCKFGIRLQTISPLKAYPNEVRGNHIFHDRTTYPSNIISPGIWINNSKRFAIEGNYFERTYPDQSTEYAYALWGYDGQFIQQSTFRANNFTGYGNGARVRDASYRLALNCNDFTDCYYGYKLGSGSQNASLSNQGTSSIGNDDAWYDPSTVAQTRVTGVANGFAWYYRNSASLMNPNYPQTTVTTINLLSMANGTSNCGSSVEAEEVTCQEIEDIMKETMSYEDHQEENIWWARQFAYYAMKDDPSLLECSEDFETFYDVLNASNIGRFAAIADKMSEDLIADAIELNEGVVPANDIENYQYQVNKIFFESWGAGISEFSVDQLAQLMEIACMSILEGGPAVADARLLLGLGDMDDLECSARMGKEDEKVSQNNMVIKPNPAIGKIVIECKEMVSAISISDMEGRILSNINVTQINNSNNTYSIDISSLESGVYLIQAYGVQQVYSSKLVKE
ncbi:MAG: T9SS type A sorting domain-containing protein [Bacteroidota bacterium]